MRKYLPSYMLPNAIICLNQFPLTQNGKIDRDELPMPTSFYETVDFIKAETLVEKKIISFYSEILHINHDKISLSDNFFERGGESLKATQLLSRIKEIFKIHLSIKDIFTHNTPKKMSQFIEENYKISTSENNFSISGYEYGSSTCFPLSPPQNRIWFVEKNSDNRIIFNNLITLQLRGLLNIDFLINALHEVCKRHEIMRTKIVIINELPYQVVESNPIFDIKIKNYNDFNLNELVLNTANKEVRTPFNLLKAPLWRVTILKFSEEINVVIFTIHQFIIDGWSMEIFYKELSYFYNTFISCEKIRSLPPLKVQYATFWLRQNEILTDAIIKDKILYWQEQLKNISNKPLSIPFARQRPPIFSYNGAVHTSKLDMYFTLQIKAFSEKNNVTPFMFLLSCFAILIFSYSKQEDLVIGTPIASRNNYDSENIIGFFTNLLSLRLHLKRDYIFENFLSVNKKIILDAFSNQELPFLTLLEKLNIDRPRNFHPLFQVVFAMQPYSLNELIFEEISVIDLDIEEPIAKFDLALNVAEKNGNYEFKFEYATDLFSKEEIVRIKSDFENLLSFCVNSDGVTISNIVENFENRVSCNVTNE